MSKTFSCQGIELPSSPVVLYDSNCRFCKKWVKRCKKLTKHTVKYMPFETAPAYFYCKVDKNACAKALHLVENGHIYRGAHAIFKVLTYSDKRSFKLLEKLYVNFFLFRFIADLVYKFIANNRQWF